MFKRFTALWRHRAQRKMRTEWQHGFMVAIGHRLFPNDLDAILPMSVTGQRRAESFYFNEAYETGMTCPMAISIPDQYAAMYREKP